MNEWTKHHSHHFGPSGVGLERIFIDLCSSEDGREEGLLCPKQKVDIDSTFEDYNLEFEEDFSDEENSEDGKEDSEDGTCEKRINSKLLVWQQVQGK